jgi:Holliday junction resolvase RusA-like endonuclease
VNEEGEMITFTIPGLPMSRNKLDNKHWAVRRAEKQRWEAEIYYAIKKAKAKKIGGVVDVSILYPFADKRRHDPHDNYSHKGTLDAIVRSGLVSDDNYEVIRRVTTQGQKGEKNETLIVIQEVK